MSGDSSKDSRSPIRDLNPGPTKYETGVLTTRPKGQVTEMEKHSFLHWSKNITPQKSKQKREEFVSKFLKRQNDAIGTDIVLCALI